MGTTTASERHGSQRYGVRLRRLAAVLAGVAVAEMLGILLLAAVGDERFLIGPIDGGNRGSAL